MTAEEDQSVDSEMEVDWWQQVSYFVMDGFSDLTGDVYTPPQSNAGGMKLARPVLEEATPTPTATPSATPTQQANVFTGAAYTYDGDGNMVKSVIDGVTTYYVGGYYELLVEGETETEVKYYYAASLRIAMRTDGILNWLFSDHLSSTTIITDESGSVVSEMKYTAFGELRASTGTNPTDYLYTGQRYEVEFGLSYYVARWYDADLGHFISADTIIPQPGNALDWDRYAYVLWNPINLNDPTGNNPECGPDGVYCDHDNWNDYEYDPVPLSDGGKRIIRIAREIERLTGNNVNLSTLLRLVFEREFNGFGKLEGRGLKEAFIEAGVRNYLWWSDSRYHQQSNVTLINWLGDSQGVSYSLERELFINIPSGLRVVDQVIGKTRTYQYNAGVANTMAMQIQNPPEEWLKLDLDAPFGYAYCRSENECMIPYQNKQEEFWLLADTSKDNLGNYIFSTDIASTYFKSSISYIVTYRQAQYWNSP